MLETSLKVKGTRNVRNKLKGKGDQEYKKPA